MTRVTGWVHETWSALVDLVFPVECAGCAATGTQSPPVPVTPVLAAPAPLHRGVCPGCAAAVRALRPGPVRPVPAPPGLPPCTALGRYDAVLRELLLGYKERGRHGLAGPLGALLAEVIASAGAGGAGVGAGVVSVGAGAAVSGGGGVPGGAGRSGPVPVLLVPVPGTAQAARRRHGDHLRRLTRHAAAWLRRAGWPVAVRYPVRALPRPDSAGLDSAGRAAAAAAAFRVRPGRAARLAALTRAYGATVVLVDDVITTGATAAAVTARLAEAGVTVHALAVLAATARRQPSGQSTRKGVGNRG